MNMKRFPLGELWTNCYLVWDGGGKGFIVDPGGPAETVKGFIESNKIEIEYIFLTHGHADHIGGLQDVRPLSKNGVAVHVADADFLTDARKNFSLAMGFGLTVPAAEIILKDGDKFSVGEMTVEVIHTPGHTPGGVCFYVKDAGDEILICGDTLFARSIGRTDLPGGDEGTLIDSLRRLERFHDKLKAYPGHGPSTTIGEEKIYNPYWPKQ